MPASDPSRVRARAKSGVAHYLLRSGGLHLMQAASVVALGRWLGPADFGAYAVLNAWISVSWYFCDVGIAGALTRQAAAPTEAQLRACATTQVGLGAAFAALFLAAADWIAGFHGLGAAGGAQLRILALTIPIYALRGVPRLLLERDLRFRGIARYEVGEAAAMYVTQITLAGLGAGAWSFVTANAARAVTGSIVVVGFAASRLRWRFPPRPLLGRRLVAELRPLLPFGLPFQANAVVPALRGLLVPLVLARALPIEEVGHVSWALSLAAFPMTMAHAYNQVAFPSLSRLNSDLPGFRAVASRGTELALLGLAYLFGAAAACAWPLARAVFGQRWEGAEAYLPLAMLGTGLFAARLLAASILNASGRSGTRLGIEAAAVSGEVALSIAVTHWFLGVGYLWAWIAAQGVALVATGARVTAHLEPGVPSRLLAAGFGAVAGVVGGAMGAGWAVPLGPAGPPLGAFIGFNVVFLGVLAALDVRALRDVAWTAREAARFLRAWPVRREA